MTRFNATSLSFLRSVAQRGEMRPFIVTVVISTINKPAAPMDNEPRCIRCQSVAQPSVELYWHMGDTTMRFGRVRSRRLMGENRALGTLPSFRTASAARLARSREPVRGPLPPNPAVDRHGKSPPAGDLGRL